MKFAVNQCIYFMLACDVQCYDWPIETKNYCNKLIEKQLRKQLSIKPWGIHRVQPYIRNFFIRNKYHLSTFIIGFTTGIYIFECVQWENVFKAKRTLNRQIKDGHNNKLYYCYVDTCKRIFLRRYYLMNQGTTSLCTYFFWSSGIIECTSMLFTFENALGASVVWHHLLPLMNSYNKTEAAVFSCRLFFLRVFHFISLI